MNAIMNWFSGDFFGLLGWTLLHSLWQGALIALLYGLALTMLQHRGAHIRYILSLFFLLLIPITSLITIIYLHDHSPAFSSMTQSPVKISPLSFLTARQGLEPIGSIISWESVSQFINNFITRNLPLVNFCWMTGFLVFGIRFMGGMMYTRRLRHRYVVPVNGLWLDKIEFLSRSIGIRRDVRLMGSLLVKMPVVVGYFKPVILVPLGIFSQIPPEQISAILTHELAHIYRRDYLVNVFQTVIEAFFFFHPAVWWISSHIRTEREYICDDITLKAGHDPLIYSRALACIEELQWKAPAMVAAIAGNKNQLLCRIKRMLEPKYRKPTFSGGLVMLLIIIGVIAVTTAAAVTFEKHGSEMQNMNNLITESSPGFAAAQFAGILPFLPPETRLDPESQSAQAEGWQNLPDTTKQGSQKQHEEALKQFEEAQKALQEAETRMKEAQKLQWEAQRDLEERYREQHREQIDKYREAMREYEERIRESVREYQKKLQELYSKDSLNKWAPFMQLPGIDEEYPWLFDLPQDDVSALHQFYYLPTEPFGHIPDIPDELHGYYDPEWYEDRFEGFDTAYNNFYYQFDSISYPDDIMMDLPHLYGNFVVPSLPELPVVPYYTIPDCGELEKELQAPGLLGHVYMSDKPRIREVIWNELLDDGLIEEGEPLIVNISSRSMTINGEKQTKEVHRKYKTLLEKTIGDIGSSGLTYFF